MGNKEQLRKLYDSWHENNRNAILQGNWDIVDNKILAHPKRDKLRGLNLVAYLPDHISQKINTDLLPRLVRIVGKSGWTVSAEGRHFTILDMIPHNSGIGIDKQRQQANKYSKVVENLTGSFDESVEIDLQGIFASPDGITIQGYPVGEGLHKLRESLRRSLFSEGLTNLEKKKYKIETAHVALVKFTSPLDGGGLLRVVDGLRDFPIGKFKVSEVVLNISPRYDKHKTIEVVKRFQIGC